MGRPEDSELGRAMRLLFAAIENFFARADKDGSGMLGSAELQDTLVRMGVSRGERAEAIMKKVDPNNTGQVGFPEMLLFCYFWSEVGSYEEIFGPRDGVIVGDNFKFLEKCYLAFDADRSYKMSRSELSAFFTTYLSVLPPSFAALCETFFPPKENSELNFKLFLALLYTLFVPEGKYPFQRSLATRPQPKVSPGTPEASDLWRMLESAFRLVEKDFKRFDVDGDNAVDIHEMTSAMKGLDSAEAIMAIGTLQGFFHEVDVDGSGYIDFKEFIYLVYLLCQKGSYKAVVEDAVDAALVKKAFATLRQCYTKYDADQSNRLDESEATKFATDFFGSVPRGFLDNFHGLMNPAKKTIDLVKFFTLLYSTVCPNGTYLNKTKRIPVQPNPQRADLPAPKTSASNQALQRVMPLNPSEITKGKQLGKGGCGVVYQATLRGQPVAAKFLLGADNQDTMAEFKNEITLMEKLTHPNIVFLVGYNYTPPNYCIVTELCANGSLFDLIQKQGRKLSKETVLRIAREIAAGLVVLHHSNPPVIHRDLKSLNVLVDADFHAKVADFGLSTLDKNRVHTPGIVGTPCWAAPEVLMGQVYNTKADVYSFGILLWEMAHLSLPYTELPHLTVTQIMNQVVMQNLRPRISSKCDPGLASLMQKCWQANPSVRPTMDECLATLNSLH